MSERIDKTRIKFTYNDKDYVLEVTPATLKKMEDMGFSFKDLSTKIVTVKEKLFMGAFIENHPSVSDKTKREIYKKLAYSAENQEIDEDTDDPLFDAIYSMYDEAFEELNSNRGKQGNLKWTVENG